MYRYSIIIYLSAAVLILMLAGCATLPKDFNRPESYALINTEDTAFGRDHAEERAAHPGKSGFHLLSNGLDAFVARAVSSHYAERSIDVQYYLYHNDLVSRLFTDLLLKAADRGVRVRMLVDDMDLAGRDLGAAALDSHPNIEVRIFNLIPNIIWHRCSNPIWKELIIISPYFVPGKSGTFFFDPAGQRGVRVRILTNSLASNAVGLVHSGYRKYRKSCCASESSFMS